MNEDFYSLTENWKRAIQAEQDAQDLYIRMGAAAQDPATKDLFRALAAQETKHKELLEDEYRRVFESEM
jgi:rubrerythrin